MPRVYTMPMELESECGIFAHGPLSRWKPASASRFSETQSKWSTWHLQPIPGSEVLITNTSPEGGWRALIPRGDGSGEGKSQLEHLGGQAMGTPLYSLTSWIGAGQDGGHWPPVTSKYWTCSKRPRNWISVAARGQWLLYWREQL